MFALISLYLTFSYLDFHNQIFESSLIFHLPSLTFPYLQTDRVPGWESPTSSQSQPVPRLSGVVRCHHGRVLPGDGDRPGDLLHPHLAPGQGQVLSDGGHKTSGHL